MPAGGSRHSQFDELPLPMLEGVDHQKLLSVNRVVQGEAWELQIHPHVQAPAGTQPYTPAGQEACTFSWLAPARMASHGRPYKATQRRLLALADAAQQCAMTHGSLQPQQEE